MTSQTHHKHPKLTKPDYGYCHKNEWAILGTTCDRINEIASFLRNANHELKSVFIDADHHESSDGFEARDEKFVIEKNYHSLINEHDHRSFYNEADFILINGNHYPATRQIVVIDSEKIESLRRRLDQISHVDLVLTKGDEEVFDFIRPKLNEQTRVLHIANEAEYAKVFSDLVKETTPPLKALILAGGMSSRMGKDKSQLNFHGRPQEFHLAQMCADLGLETFISKREDEEKAFPVLADRFVDLGPFGAICTAFMHDPDAAWLVLACDLPFISKEFLIQLIQKRDRSKVATTVQSNQKDFPEPLVTIYEPRAYQRFLSFLSMGHSCPRKVVINSDCKKIEVEDDIVKNVNTIQDLKQIENQMNPLPGLTE